MFVQAASPQLCKAVRSGLNHIRLFTMQVLHLFCQPSYAKLDIKGLIHCQFDLKLWAGWSEAILPAPRIKFLECMIKSHSIGATIKVITTQQEC